MNKEDLFVHVWKKEITIPTYPVGKPDKNPMFFEKRVYQGSSGVVYPNPIIEEIYDEKEEKTYTGLFLENKYLKILILPELGGRVQMAYDKTKKRHFVYHNQVIKPALVGLLGPWLSGGIEFNWPQHHRPSTFQPIDYTIEENEDGSKTVWTNEIELMFHTKGMAGFTLYLDRAYLEISVQLYNRTKLPQTFLWWANPAVSVNEHYQSVFPPDVNAVFDHGKRDVATFPIAKGTYYKVDYLPGTDISRYKNIPVPTSYMAIQSDYDFVGGYEHDNKGGLLHVANHHVSPGKKQWTWGNGDFGKAWGRNLTDKDGPYIELMTGVYTDNQPDFTWLMPYEEKSFSQYFMPYQNLGVIKNANENILLNIKSDGTNRADIKVYATSVYEKARVCLYINSELVFEDTCTISPESVYETKIKFPQKIQEKNYVLIVEDGKGNELLRYDPSQNQEEDTPKAAKPAKQPEEIDSIEQLFLTGLHLEQYRHATYRPEDYYLEALRREPGDVRNNNALGKWYLRQGRFRKSEAYFRKAIETLTQRNPNPYNGEPYYNLGLSLKYQEKNEGAYAAFYKACWNSAWQDSGYYSLAEINVANNDYEQALEHINWSLDRNARNGKAWTLKAAILRKLGRYNGALEVTQTEIERDLFNLSAYFEQYLSYQHIDNQKAAQTAYDRLMELSRGYIQNFIAYALDYASAGMTEEAISLLSKTLKASDKKIPPIALYYLGWFYSKRQFHQKAQTWYNKGAEAIPFPFYPNRLEAIPVLIDVMKHNPSDAKAPFYLGCLYYDKRQHKLAVKYWEQSRELDYSFPTVHRNLGIAYFNKHNDTEKAIQSFEEAFRLDPKDSRVFMELDQLYKRTNKDPQNRLSILEEYPEHVESRDDVYLECVAIYNFLGQHEKAYKLLMDRTFHPWEGGEGRVSGQYVYSLTEMAKADIRNGQFLSAIEKLNKAQTYPHNLGEGKLFGTRENDLHYWLGIAYQQLNNLDKAKNHWEKATKGDYEPLPAIFYNDQPADKILYQGLAWQKLGCKEKADNLFQKMLDYGEEHLSHQVSIDYFAISLPDLLIFDGDLQLRNKIHCTYMMALGAFGTRNLSKVNKLLNQILNWDVMHFGAKTHSNMIQWMKKQENTKTINN